ncbi:MAG: RlmE family RNA methyltransferase [Ectothiorhodospiraceae bacterium AqS1]|nr:RlmE family RNA methyltransferase [Ectothiorhodospiraceae bacterium AqS1]
MGKKRGSWHRQREQDAFFHDAKRLGLRSRAAFKLEAMAVKDRLFRPGQTVVDLGAAPGGWSEVTRRAVGPTGKVVAIDRLEMEPIAGVQFINGDFLSPEVLGQLQESIGELSADLVLSDMAPNLSGVKANDQARWRELADGAVDFALGALKPEGAFLIKLLQGEEAQDYLRMLRRAFVRVMIKKPPASRDRSSEVYALARGIDSKAGSFVCDVRGGPESIA